MSQNLKPLNDLNDYEVLALVNSHGSINKAAEASGYGRTSFQNRVRLIQVKFTSKRTPKGRAIPYLRGESQYFIFTSAQEKTAIHKRFWENLQAYSKFLSADIMIGGFSYMIPHADLWDKESKKKLVFDPLIADYIVTERITIGQGKAAFCGEMNTLPTAVRPLTGFEAYTRDKWGFFPHPKVHLQSVPTKVGTPAKQIMTTGAITLPHYVQKKAGIKAEFHHQIGALVVCVDVNGDIFSRHILADEDGSFQDLVFFVKDGVVGRGPAAKVGSFGDVHMDQTDNEAMGASFDNDHVKPLQRSMTSVMKIENGIIHDVLDFRYRNHHDAKDFHKQYEKEMTPRGSFNKSVEAEIKEVGNLLKHLSVAYPHTSWVVVESNHDQAFKKWLNDCNYKYDIHNARFFLESQLRMLDILEEAVPYNNLLEYTIRDYYTGMSNVSFLMEKDQYFIGPVDHSNHGHSGANGARGNPTSFSRMGTKMTIGHFHSPAIIDGVFVNGTLQKLLCGYNEQGFSSWMHANSIQYQNDKRVLITIIDGKWRENSKIMRDSEDAYEVKDSTI